MERLYDVKIISLHCTRISHLKDLVWTVEFTEACCRELTPGISMCAYVRRKMMKVQSKQWMEALIASLHSLSGTLQAYSFIQRSLQQLNKGMDSLWVVWESECRRVLSFDGLVVLHFVGRSIHQTQPWVVWINLWNIILVHVKLLAVMYGIFWRVFPKKILGWEGNYLHSILAQHCDHMNLFS